MKNVVLAKSAGFCFGVKRAVNMVYEEIDKLEKTKLNVKEYSKREEEFELFAWIAFLCVLLDVLLRNTLLKKIP